jgi:hypothetical protein
MYFLFVLRRWIYRFSRYFGTKASPAGVSPTDYLEVYFYNQTE